MNVVDSSGWLEYFADGPNARFFAPAIDTTEKLVVPTVKYAGSFESEALQAVAHMQQGQVVPLDVLKGAVWKLGDNLFSRPTVREVP